MTSTIFNAPDDPQFPCPECLQAEDRCVCPDGRDSVYLQAWRDWVADGRVGYDETDGFVDHEKIGGGR